MKNSSKRDPSCDFNDIDEGEDELVATPVNQSNSKIDVESLLRKAEMARNQAEQNLSAAKQYPSPYKPVYNGGFLT